MSSHWPLLAFVNLKKLPTVSSGNMCLSIILSLEWTSGLSC
uniref:Alternative protein HP1BP3 n=1 Tax=Homo sapiens TaxID=9606 RepID=L8E9W8_HUMAN|nr:alternative protein HP1BP3 [Homo sapiens]